IALERTQELFEFFEIFRLLKVVPGEVDFDTATGKLSGEIHETQQIVVTNEDMLGLGHICQRLECVHLVKKTSPRSHLFEVLGFIDNESACPTVRQAFFQNPTQIWCGQAGLDDEMSLLVSRDSTARVG